MKVVIYKGDIVKDYWASMTTNKSYEVYDEGYSKQIGPYYAIFNDNGVELHLERKLFICLSEIREKKLSSLGI